jgi:tetratricopeptide (TPR) repeat protein
LLELWTVLGSFYTENREFDKAEFSFEKATSLQGPDEYKFMTVYAWEGKLHTLQGKFDQAHDALERAIQLREQYDDVPRHTQALIYMGDYYKEMEDNDKAITYYNKAQKLASKHGLVKREHATLFRLAQCLEDNTEELHKVTVNMYQAQKKLVEQGERQHEV